MRLASALVPILLFAASAAVAASPQAGQGSTSGDQAQAGQPQVARKTTVPDDGAAHLTRTIYPSYHNDPDTEAYCYYVSGDLRCDRIRARHPGHSTK